tara:strand:+ start:8032 stop:9861 length:1830 start_codon:yes stop_codon:yes gene_type:complete
MTKSRKFKTESQQLLHLMTHSIYTHKEIFLRELISNSSDAIDKRHFMSLTNDKIPKENYEIKIIKDKKNRVLRISDNGIGLTYDDLVNNLGTIAKSGTKEFQEKLEKKDSDLIGQFGVGFYSAFMVAKKVIVETKSIVEGKSLKWSSNGISSYSITEGSRESYGTEIQLHLREDLESDEYSKFLEDSEINKLVKKYSDYIRYPIKSYNEDEKEEKTLNTMIPLWKKAKKDISEDDYNSFYKNQFNEFDEPLKVIHSSVEGLLTYTTLLFIPKKPEYNFYSESFEKGIQLYSKGVFIENKNKSLIPDHFKFVKGLVDSADLSLNLSREMLQNDRQLKKIASHIEKKINNELKALLKNDRNKYEEFYKNYRLSLKYGVYDMFGQNKEKLQDLILFETSKSEKPISFKEYLDRKPKDQENIYYATGKSRSRILNLPQMELMKEKDIEVLLCYDDVDEFMFQSIQEYDKNKFLSVQKANLDIDKKDPLKSIKKKKENQFLVEIKEVLKDKVKDVVVSKRLSESPVCVVSGEGLSLEMEKVLNQMPSSNNVKAEKIIEVNLKHKLIKKLFKNLELKKYDIKYVANLLYNQALILEGLQPENPKELIDAITNLIE